MSDLNYDYSVLKYGETLWEEIKCLRERNRELENQLIECKRAMDASRDSKNLYDVAQDLIELKRAEEELKKERDYFKNVLDNSADAIGIVDSKGRFIRWNKRAEELFGYSFEELKGKSAFDLYANKQDLNDMLRELRKKGYVRDYEISIRRKDRQIIPFGMSISVLKDGEKNIGSVCVARDLSQIKQVQQDLQKSKEDAEMANKAKSEFLANMSHEIRTPMNAILGFSEALLNKTQEEQQRQYLKTILSSGKTLLSLIDDILDLSKIEAGRLEIQPENVNPASLLQDISAIFDTRFEKKGIDFILDIDPSLPEILKLDEVRIRQILLNLVGNALKFTSSGYVKTSIYARNKDLQGKKLDLLIQVEDTGIGIPESQQEVVFENFRQRDNQYTREFGGSGLGLSITKRLVDLMNGSISVDSEVDKGSIFTVLLKQVEIGEKENVQGYKIDRQLQLGTGKIVVADNVKENIELIQAYLENTNIQTIAAHSVQEAWEKIEKHVPDLVLMDLRMPDKNGYDALWWIREKFCTIPVLAFTATVMKQDREHILKYFDGYISKPVDKESLLQNLTRFLSTQGKNYLEKRACNSGLKPVKQENQLCPRDLYSLLQNQFVPRWKELKEVLIMEDVEKFAQDLKKAGEYYSYFPIKDFSERLYKSIQRYDIDGVKGILDKFPEFVEAN